jgi:hypothetical protein
VQDYLIVRGQIDPIEYDTTPATYKPEEWKRMDQVARATIRMHLSESVYYTVSSLSASELLVSSLSTPDRCMSRMGTAEVLD